MLIKDVESWWPRSAHDSFVLNQSEILDSFEGGDFGRYWLLGVSGYGCNLWLLTPGDP